MLTVAEDFLLLPSGVLPAEEQTVERVGDTIMLFNLTQAVCL
jgi:hypothetical protein